MSVLNNPDGAARSRIGWKGLGCAALLLVMIGGAGWLLRFHGGDGEAGGVPPLLMLGPSEPVASEANLDAAATRSPVIAPALIPDAVRAAPGRDHEATRPAEAEPASRGPSTVEAPAESWSGVTFDNRPIRPVRTVRMKVTAYSPDERSCGPFADNVTASGYSVWTNGMKLVAADTRLLPFGSIVTVPGYDGGHPVPVLDRGGAIEGQRLDVLYPTHEAALEWGVRWLDVVVWEYADEEGVVDF